MTSRSNSFYRKLPNMTAMQPIGGASKGLDRFQDVCIVLNKTTLVSYKKGKLDSVAPSTKNKLYVACTRARGDIYMIPHTFIDKYKK